MQKVRYRFFFWRHAIQSVPEDGADQSGPWSSPFLLRRRLLFHLLFVIIIDHRNMLRWL